MSERLTGLLMRARDAIDALLTEWAATDGGCDCGQCTAIRQLVEEIDEELLAMEAGDGDDA